MPHPHSVRIYVMQDQAIVNHPDLLFFKQIFFSSKVASELTLNAINYISNRPLFVIGAGPQLFCESYNVSSTMQTQE